MQPSTLVEAWKMAAQDPIQLVWMVNEIDG